jgi:catechol 2,3-dioxygenase-like lactoylglutathione lyase family enzyme
MMTHSLVSSLRSAAIGVPDITGVESFFTNTWKLQISARTPQATYLRGTSDAHHILSLHPSRQPEIHSITFRVRSGSDLEKIATATPANGGVVLVGPGAIDEPGGGVGLTIRDPQNRILRFVHEDERLPDLGRIPDCPIGLTHVNLNSSNVAVAQRFFEHVLGFTLSDRSREHAFIRCNADHHSIVLADYGVNGLNHIAFLMPDIESVMRGSGRVIDAGYPIAWGVGRHGPGNNVFAYFIGPFGFIIEYTAEILQVDDSYVARGPEDWSWPPGRADQWGIATLPSKSLKEAQRAIFFAEGD